MIGRPWFGLFVIAVTGCGTTATVSPLPANPGAAPPVLELTIADVHAAYARGTFTAVQLTQAHLARIDRYESHYNAFISLNPAALSIAAQLDSAYETSGIVGPLHGIPVVIKDNIDYGGLVTTAGYSGFSSATGGIDLIPDDHAAVVERLEDAGAIILGKTNLPDFAGHGTRTRSSVAGATLNPYDVTRAPGGSSGGTATAVNASFAVLGLGTETGGSIQNPAAAQGLVGVKPTFGLVPLEGVVPINATYVDVVGPLARTVHDAAVALDVVSGPTIEDLASFASEGHRPDSGYASGLSSTALEGKRFGLVGAGWRTRFLPLAPDTDSLYRRAVAVLQDRGATVVDDPFRDSGFIALYETRPRVPTQGAHDLLIYLRNTGPGAAFHSVAEWEALTGRPFRERRRRAAPPARPSATEAGDAFQSWRHEIRHLWREIMERHDLDGLFFPQAGAPIRPLIENPDSVDYNPNNHPELPSNIINDIGLPVVTVPVDHYADGMPFVIAFIGDMWTEKALLDYAFDLEQATRARRPPALVVKPD